MINGISPEAEKWARRQMEALSPQERDPDELMRLLAILRKTSQQAPVTRAA